MNSHSKKDIDKASLTKVNQPPLSIEEMISYQRFLLMTTEKTIREGKKFNSIMDGVIEELENNLSAVEQQNGKFKNVLQQNQMEFNKLTEERKSEEDLWDQLGPKMQILQKNMNHAISMKDEYQRSCLKLKEVKSEYEKEESYFNTAESILNRKEEEVRRLRTEIEWQDKETARLYKLLKHYESQNEEMYILKKRLNNDLQEVKGNIRVYCRVRPPTKGQSIISVTSDNTLKITYERQRNRQENQKYEQGYVFEQIFNQNQTQHTIFTDLSQLVQNSIDGKNVCIFAYGQTGSGKTYTLLGPEYEGKSKEQHFNDRGLAPRSIELIFKQIKHSRKFKWNFKAFLTIQEIYLENIIDLLAKAETVKDKCIEYEVSEAEQVLAYMKEAIFHRKFAATNINERSSRSHLIITLRLEGISEKNEDKRYGSLVFVDLAGSERLKQSKVEGEHLKETQFINKSLSALGTVINEMRKESEHVSFRNSKLTHVLQRYLQGESKTLMFVNVSPDFEDMNQTKISLGFAENVRECKVKK